MASDKTDMPGSELLRHRLRRQIRAKVWPFLEAEGFVEFEPFRAYRIGDGVIELVEFTTFQSEWREPRWIGGQIYANGGTFSLYVGVLYFAGECPGERPSFEQCHRATRLAKENCECPAEGRTFYPGPDGERIEEVVDEATRVLRARGFDVLSHYSARKSGCPGTPEPMLLSAAETEEMIRICREGRKARAGALDDLHKRLHLADEHLFA